jgi:multidrug resistance efflux pump
MVQQRFVKAMRLQARRLPRWAFISASTLLAFAFLRATHSAWGTIRSDQARLLIPSLLVVPAAQPVVALEYGRLGRIFVREGAGVAPGEPLFSLQRDPQIDQELVDRGVARDLADVNEQIRDARRVIDALRERMVMARALPLPLLDQQILFARARLLRREQLEREGGVSRDLVDESRERLLRLQQERLERQQESQRLADLQRLIKQQQQIWRSLNQRQANLRQQDLQRRVASRRHPQLDVEQQDRLEYATYRAPGRGVVLRLLKQPGDPVRPRETVAILQREQQPPQVEALLRTQGAWLLATDQVARVEVPSLRQFYEARILSWKPAGRGLLQVRLNLDKLPTSESRRLLALPVEPVRVELPRQLNLVRWLQTGRLSPSLAQ